MLEFCLETYGWDPEETWSRPWGEIVELLEWRSQRLEREKEEDPDDGLSRARERHPDAVVQRVDSLEAFGIGREE